MKELLTKIAPYAPYTIGLIAATFLGKYFADWLAETAMGQDYNQDSADEYNSSTSNFITGLLTVSAIYGTNKVIEKLIAR